VAAGSVRLCQGTTKISGSLVGTAIGCSHAAYLCYRSRFSASKLVAQSGPYSDQPLGHYPCLYVDVSDCRLFSLRASRHSTVLDTVLTGILLLPLSVSLPKVRQTNLETSLKNALLTKPSPFSAWNCSRAIPTGCPPTSVRLDCTNKSTCNPQASAVVRKVCAKTNGSALHTNL